MLRSSIPAKMPYAWASAAGAGFITPIPNTPSATPGRASYPQGFPPVTFEQIAAGGTPPWGADANGILNAVTLWLQWAQAGGLPVKFDSAFSAVVGGYPQYALLLSSSPGAYGKLWLNTVDNNTTDPDSGGAANWVPFPDVLIQLQKNNYAQDTGLTNQVTVDLGRKPVSWAEIVGMPVRVKAANANTVNNPTLTIAGASGPLSPATIVNPGGAVLGIGQYVTGDILDGIPKDDGTFQLNSPTKAYSPSGTFPFAGATMPWWNETAPSGWIEIGGQTLLIASYPNLWPILGTRYGGDGINTFKMPNSKGEFLRGWDHGRGLDPNAATRTNAGGGITGDHVGTLQGYATGAPNANLTGNLTISNPIAVATGPGPGYSSPTNIASGLASGAYLADLTTPGGGWGTTFIGTPTPVPSPYTFGGTNWVGSITGAATLTGIAADLETRPVNVNVMWIMFTG